MKIIPIILTLLLLSSSVAYAQETVDVSFVPGDFLYGIKRGWETIRLSLANDPEAQAKLRAKYMEQRVLELKWIEENRPAEVSLAVEEVKKSTDEIEKLPQDVKDRINTKLNNSLTRLMAIKATILSDANPNNDNAINGIDNAIQKQQLIAQRIKNMDIQITPNTEVGEQQIKTIQNFPCSSDFRIIDDCISVENTSNGRIYKNNCPNSEVVKILCN